MYQQPHVNQGMMMQNDTRKMEEKQGLLTFCFYYGFLTVAFLAVFQTYWFFKNPTLNYYELIVIASEIIINLAKFYLLWRLFGSFKRIQEDHNTEKFLNLYALLWVLGWLGGFYENRKTTAPITIWKLFIVIAGLDTFIFLIFFFQARSFFHKYWAANYQYNQY